MITAITRVPLAHVYSIGKIKRFDSIFALPEFLYENALSLGGVPMYLEQETDDDRILWPVIISSFKKLGVFFFNRAMCPSPPQTVKGSISLSQARDIFFELANYLRRNYQCKMITLLQSPHDPKFIRDDLNSWEIFRTHDAMIDLSRDLHTIYFGFKKRHRYTLRRAIGGSDSDVLSMGWLDKTDYGVREGNDIPDLLEFRKLWTEIIQRNSALRRLMYEDPWSLERLKNIFTILRTKGLCKLLTIYDEKDRAGATMMLFMSGNFTKVPMALWAAGASPREGKRKGLPSLLQWYAIRLLKGLGYMKYYMGGIDINNLEGGPTLFKMGFGGETTSGFRATWFAPILSRSYRLAKQLLAFPKFFGV